MDDLKGLGKWIMGCGSRSIIFTNYQKELINYINEQEEKRINEKLGIPNIFIDIMIPRSFELINAFEIINHEFPDIEEMSLSKIKSKMKELNKRINNSKNPMERRGLQKELGECSKRLGELKRRV